MLFGECAGLLFRPLNAGGGASSIPTKLNTVMNQYKRNRAHKSKRSTLAYVRLIIVLICYNNPVRCMLMLYVPPLEVEGI